eukprot:Nk52_evm28s232 gene=Nk52_evmTU28s232
MVLLSFIHSFTLNVVVGGITSVVRRFLALLIMCPSFLVSSFTPRNSSNRSFASPSSSVSHHPRRVVVVGLGFGGLSVVRQLADQRIPKEMLLAQDVHSNDQEQYLPVFDIVCVDPKDYFEYTPSILKTLAFPSLSACLQELSALFVPYTVAESKMGVGASDGVDHGVVRKALNRYGRHVRYLQGKVTGINAAMRHVEVDNGSGAPVVVDGCDYVVVASGRGYPLLEAFEKDESQRVYESGRGSGSGNANKSQGIQIRGATGGEHGLSLSGRLEEIEDGQGLLEKANSAVVIGGGIVGVELVGELLDARPGVHITLFAGRGGVLGGGDNEIATRKGALPGKARVYIETFIKSRGVEIVYDDRVDSVEVTKKATKRYVVRTTQGRVIFTDMCAVCTGNVRNRYQPSVYGVNEGDCLDGGPKGKLKVDKSMRVSVEDKLVEGASHSNAMQVYAVGDVAEVEGVDDAEMAFIAEQHARIASCNIAAHARSLLTKGHGVEATSVLQYPGDLFHMEKSPMLMAISLGNAAGVFVFGRYVLTGRIVIWMKDFTEYSKMKRLERSLWAVVLWNISDYVLPTVLYLCS